MKNLASIAILTLILGCAEQTKAQIQLSLTIPNLGSPYLSDYISDESNRVLIITNTTGQQQQIFLRGKIEQLNSPGYYFRTKEDFKPLIPIFLAPFETRTLFARSEDWAFMATGQLEDNVPGPEKRRLQATGILPEGEYQICLQAYDFNTEQPVSPQEPAGCQFFLASLGSPPQILVPFCGDSIDQNYPLISWSPAIILQAMHDIVYDLYVVELVSRVLNPAEVMEQSILYRGGNPFVVENLRQTFYQFLPGDPALNPDSRYAICVVARSGRGSAMFENQGRSEICLIDTRNAQGFTPAPGTQIASTASNPDNFQLHKISHLSGRLLYRFYGDTGGPGSIQSGITAGGALQIMELQPGQSLQNQGFQVTSGNIGQQPTSYGNLSAGAFNNNLFTQPPPPQYILPAGYNLNGGKPLKQARIRFTARYAVGNKLNIQHPEDLTFVGGMGYPIRVTGGSLPEMLSIPGNTKVIATTTTDNSGDYNVSFFADETFGVITTGPVDVQWGGGEFPAGVSGYGFFRVITMEVEEIWYCHPDIVVFLQPGQSLDVPTQVVTVQSYDLRLTVKALDNDKIQFAGSGNPIPGAVAKVGRKKTYHDQAPACFPKDEIKIDQYGDVMIGTPVKNYMAADTGMTDDSGNIIFRRLVKHDGMGNCGELFQGDHPADGYYIEAVTHPTQSLFNYSKDWKSQFAPCGARLAPFCFANECAPRSASYIPPLIEEEMVLGPKWPKIRAYTQGDYGAQPQYLPNVNLMLLIWMENGDFRLKSYETDGFGHFTKQMTAPGDIGELFSWNSTSGAITSTYVMDYFKSGFKRQQCIDCGTLENKKILQMGQVWQLDIFMEPKSKVIGRVEDEHGQAIHGQVKIGDGPFTDLEMRWEIVEGIDPQNGGQPFLMPENLQVLPQGGQQFQQIPGQIQIEQELEGAMSPQNTGPSIETVSQGGFTIESVGSASTLLPNFHQVSVFEQPAQSGQQIPLIIQPGADNYFADTFYVNIPNNYDPPGFDLGTFVIKEMLHRPRIIVKHMVLGFGGGDQLPQWQEAPLEGAEVLLSNFPEKTTPANGTVQYVFGSPSTEFRLRINKQGYVPYDQHVIMPVSPDPYDIIVVLDHGKTLSGTITRASGGQPIAGARVYTEIGSNNYGPIVLETFSDQNGGYVLEGLPTETLTIEVTKSDSAVTYIGQSKPANMSLITTLNFQLAEAPFLLSHIWNLPVVVESVTPSGNNWIVSGAFVDLPHNQRFHPEDETQRLGFNNITVKKSGPAGPGGKPPAEPVASSISTNTLKFRSVLNDVHIVEMSGPKASGGLVFIYNPQYTPVSINKIRVEKGSGNGHVKARVFSLLEYFRTTYNYDGQFYLGESSDNVVISPYKGVEDLSMPEKYFLMGYNYSSNQAVNPSFTVHNFNAFTDREESYVHQDSFVLAAKLIVDLPLSNPDELIVSTGDVIVLPDKIIVNEGDEPLEFELEEWHVKTGIWEFKPNQGGIVTSGTITTNLIQFYAPHILIKPTSLQLPTGNQINLNQITLAGILDLEMEPNGKLGFDYVQSPQHTPGQGHWRVTLYNPQQNQPVAKLEGLPGWSAQTSVDIRFIENFSDGYEQLTLAPNQTVNHYNVIQQTISNISFFDGGVALVGSTNLGIPNLANGASANFIYYLEQNTLKVRVQGLYTLFESTGQVEFQGDQQHDRIFLDWNHFEVTGGITIYDDLSSNEIHLRGKLIKKPNDIRIKIILVDPGGQLEGNIEQLIVLGGGQNGAKRVLQGEQLVSQMAWQHLVYQARFEGFGGSMEPGHDIMWFKVNGALINDPTQGDEIELANIETPFGDFALTLDFGEMAIVGDLRVANISMGAVTIIEGVINMRMGGLGFYLVAHLRALYPVIAELNTNFIVGYYPHIAPDAQQILKTGMYIQTLPAFLTQSGIQGLYICANKPMFEVDWEVDLLVFAIGVYANAGIDARFWLNFGEAYGAAHLGGLAYADFELYVSVLGICEMCLGVLAELGFDVGYEWVPTTNFAISICGTIGFNVSFCGESFNETAKLEVGWTSSSGDVYYEAELGASCSGNAASGPSGCKHF